MVLFSTYILLLLDLLLFYLNESRLFCVVRRAIFRWITVKDLNAIDFQNNLATDTPMGLLRGIKYGTETYHTLFMRLCR